MVTCYDEGMGKWKKFYTIVIIGAYLSVRLLSGADFGANSG